MLFVDLSAASTYAYPKPAKGDAGNFIYCMPVLMTNLHIGGLGIQGTRDGKSNRYCKDT